MSVRGRGAPHRSGSTAKFELALPACSVLTTLVSIWRSVTMRRSSKSRELKEQEKREKDGKKEKKVNKFPRVATRFQW